MHNIDHHRDPDNIIFFLDKIKIVILKVYTSSIIKNCKIFIDMWRVLELFRCQVPAKNRYVISSSIIVEKHNIRRYILYDRFFIFT